MRHFLLRLAIALISFAVGVGAAMVFGFGNASHPPVEVEVRDMQEDLVPPPIPARPYACPGSQKGAGDFEVIPPPMPEAPPPPATPKREKTVRIIVNNEDGTESVIRVERDADKFMRERRSQH